MAHGVSGQHRFHVVLRVDAQRVHHQVVYVERHPTAGEGQGDGRQQSIGLSKKTMVFIPITNKVDHYSTRPVKMPPFCSGRL